jgi:hypothetical protein
MVDDRRASKAAARGTAPRARVRCSVPAARPRHALPAARTSERSLAHHHSCPAPSAPTSGRPCKVATAAQRNEGRPTCLLTSRAGGCCQISLRHGSSDACAACQRGQTSRHRPPAVSALCRSDQVPGAGGGGPLSSVDGAQDRTGIVGHAWAEQRVPWLGWHAMPRADVRARAHVGRSSQADTCHHREMKPKRARSRRVASFG